MGAVADDILELRQAFDDAELRGDADRLDALRHRLNHRWPVSLLVLAWLAA
jgi:hypothetical protein